MLFFYINYYLAIHEIKVELSNNNEQDDSDDGEEVEEEEVYYIYKIVVINYLATKSI